MTFENFVDAVMDMVEQSDVELSTISSWLIVQALSLMVEDLEVTHVRLKAGMMASGEFKMEVSTENTRLLH